MECAESSAELVQLVIVCGVTSQRRCSCACQSLSATRAPEVVVMIYRKNVMRSSFSWTPSTIATEIKQSLNTFNLQFLKFRFSYLLLRIHLLLFVKPAFFSARKQYEVYQNVWSLQISRYFGSVSFCDLFMKLICMVVFDMYRGELNKHFDGSIVVIRWKVTILDPFMFPLPHNFDKKSRMWTSLWGWKTTTKLPFSKVYHMNSHLQA